MSAPSFPRPPNDRIKKYWGDTPLAPVKPLTRTPLVAGNMPGVLRYAEKNRIYEEVKRQIEERVERLIAGRHGYPMWPERDIEDQPMDAFERQYHGEIRSTYYQETIFLIQMVRELRRAEGQ